MGFLDSLRTYAGSWSVTGSEKLSAAEVRTVDRVEVVEKDNDWGTSVSMCFFMKSGGRKYVPLSRDSSLKPGDSVKPNSIKILTLEKDGEEPIYRADGDAM